ncbi:MAG: hypothetical protein JXR64_03000 [Spirochaetales bacterium]|nr:hypothetical protein [Spirochaetales bacterium]
MKSKYLTKDFAKKYIYPFVYHNKKRRYIDTERFSPVIYENDLPAEGDLFHFRYEEVPYNSEKDRAVFMRDNDIIIDDIWWEKQKARCEEGYIVKNATNLGEDVWIPGRMYFFLNFWAIRRNNKYGRKQLGNPRFIDMGLEKFFLVRELSILFEKNNAWQKSRQKGFSEMAGCDIGYEFTFFKDSQSVVISGEEKYTFNLMNFVARGLKYLSNTQFHVQPGVYRKTEYISAKYRGSEIYGRTAKNNAEAASSLSPSLIYFEEGGIWEKDVLTETYEFVSPSLMAENRKTGYAYFIATGGDMKKGVDTMQSLFYNPKSYGLLEFNNVYEKDITEAKVGCFVPAIYFEVIDKDGNSLIEESISSIVDQRANKKINERYRFITQKPLTPSESFMTSVAGYFGEEIIQRLNERKSYLLGNPSKHYHLKGYLKWINPNNKHFGVEFIESEEETWCNIFEPPVLDSNGNVLLNLYKAGTDSYDQDEAHTSTSEGSIQVYKGFNNINDTYNKYVARITERPREGEGGSSRFYEWSLMLSIYYNVVNLIEFSKILIIHYFVENGFEHLLKEKPEFFLSTYVENSKSANRWGIDPSTKSVWLTKMRDWLIPENIEKMDDIRQIDALAKFRYDPSGKKYNCDITISSSLCQVVAYDDQDILVVESENDEEESYGIHYKMGRNGSIIQTI